MGKVIHPCRICDNDTGSEWIKTCGYYCQLEWERQIEEKKNEVRKGD